MTNPYLTATVRQHDLSERSGCIQPTSALKSEQHVCETCVSELCVRRVIHQSGLGGAVGGGRCLRKKKRHQTKHGQTSVLNAHRCLCVCEPAAATDVHLEALLGVIRVQAIITAGVSAPLMKRGRITIHLFIHPSSILASSCTQDCRVG